MSMDAWEVFRTLASAFAVLVALAALVLARRDRGSDKVNASLSRLETTLGSRIDSDHQLSESRHASNTKRLGGIEAHISALDEAIKHVPTQNDFRSLQMEIGLVATSVARLDGTLESSTRMVERMNQYLMEKGT
ncbi:MAG: hypothetical protein ACT4PZ_19415 [Panacagrimonas sp.]